MTISYHWLHDYLPVKLDPEQLSKILTSIGLEVEAMHHYEEVPGNLQGLVTGEVIECGPHPNADKLKITQVSTGAGSTLAIVCGAPNVAAGQKVVVAVPGTTIHPVKGEPVTLKAAKIRGVESHGMLCAEDEIGIGENHDGIIVLPPATPVGVPAAQVFNPYTDWVYEIGLTPNRMDAMSHLGVARDVCAYLTHHEGKVCTVKLPYPAHFEPGSQAETIAVTIENPLACARYSGISVSGITPGPSPAWMQHRLRAIGLRPINNVVDITNYILHETGQPLHAFDAHRIAGSKIIVKNLPEGTPFIALDGKERKLGAEDLMICDGSGPVAIGGVFGGLNSGIQDDTRDIFLESAWFEPQGVRKTSMKLGLRTDAAIRFEKGVDISGTVQVLQRAALMIKELAGGKISSRVTDVFPQPPARRTVSLTYSYLERLSGKAYPADAVKKILTALGFTIESELKDQAGHITGISVAVPFHKTDISIPADLVEEVMRIDGLDNIEIPVAIRISPAVETNPAAFALKEKIAGYLVGLGFNEVLTNSISNSAYFDAYPDGDKVRLLNNLSSELDVLRPSMLETGLETLAFNLNRKNLSLKMFEFGKTYGHLPEGETGLTPFREVDHLCLYLTGSLGEDTWHLKTTPVDYYYAKGVTEALLGLCGLKGVPGAPAGAAGDLASAFEYTYKGPDKSFAGARLARVGQVDKKYADRFDIRQPVFFVDMDWAKIASLYSRQVILYQEVARFPAVQRDLALVVDESIPYAKIEAAAFKDSNKLKRLRSVQLFDVFRSEKLGAGKKSVALSFTFQDEEKTLTDKEIDAMMQQLTRTFESELGAGLRK